MLVPLYTIFLWLSNNEKNKDISPNNVHIHASNKLLDMTTYLSFALSATGLLLTLSTHFRETLPYFLITVLIPFLNVVTAFYKPRGMIIASYVLWHLMLLLGNVPATGIAIGEGTGMLREMALNDHWRFEWAHNPSYNPLPTMAFIQATLSRVAGTDWYSWALGTTVFLGWAVAYDISVYLLTLYVTGETRAALLSIPLIAVTPETAIHQHPYQWSGNMLVLLASMVLVKAVQGMEKPTRYILLMTLLFTGAILAHATALAYIFVLLGLLATRYMYPLLGKLHLRMEKTPIERIVLPATLVLVVIFFIRSLYVSGFAQYVMPSFLSVYNGLVGIIKSFLIPTEEHEIGAAIHIPLYERAEVSPIQAYVWSYTASLATAYFIYALFLKRRVSSLQFSLYVTSVLILSVSFMGYSILKEKNFYLLNRTTYVFIPFIAPMASLTLSRIFGLLRRRKISLRALGLASMLMFIATAPIAAQDPNISPIQYARIRNSESVPLSMGDILIAKSFLGQLDVSSVSQLYLTSSRLYMTGMYRLTPQGSAVGIWLPTYTSRFKEALGLTSFIDKLQLPAIHLSTDSSSYTGMYCKLIYSIGIDSTSIYICN
ncbi:hypothetical protein [Desulfurococcus mucosus]|uniref:hypothetical protein n=1 Tax=Desulfurococcus mucosus TaxID=2275 RepID=UPI0016513D48|nr:hypothetical protein [Desulfurococcus mucosus]